MGLYRGNTKLSKIYRGNTEIDKIYRGQTEVYSPSFPGDSVSNPASSPQDIRNAGITENGSYYIYAPTNGQTSIVQANVYFNLVDGKDWVEFFTHPYRGTPSINLLGNSIPWKGYCIETPNIDRYYTYFSTYQPADTRNSTSTSTGGNKSGYKVFFGYAGGMGIYNAAVNGTCNWSNNSGGVGAGYDGSCGSFPNDLRMGTSGSPYVSAISGTWKHYLWMDSAS